MKCQYLFFFIPCLLFSFSEKELAAFVTKHNASAAAVAFVDGEKTEVYTHGNLSLHSTIPVNEHTLFRIGYLTHLFSAHVLTELSLDKKVHLTDPVSKYFPKKQKLPTFHDTQITLHDLATHTSGLPASAFATNHPQLLQSRLLYSFLSNYVLKTAPGKTIEPSFVGYALLTSALTRASKESMSTLVEKVVCNKLQMKDTTYSVSKQTQQSVATGYLLQQELKGKGQENKGSAFYDSLGLYSSISDMARFLSYHINSHDNSFDKTFYESPLGVMGLSKHSDGSYSLSSSIMGFSAYMTFSKTTKKGHILLINREDLQTSELQRFSSSMK